MTPPPPPFHHYVCVARAITPTSSCNLLCVAIVVIVHRHGVMPLDFCFAGLICLLSSPKNFVGIILTYKNQEAKRGLSECVLWYGLLHGIVRVH